MIIEKKRSRNTKFEHILVYENNSDKFDIGQCTIRVKVTVGLHVFSPFTAVLQIVRSYNLTLVQAMKLVLSIYVHLIIIMNILMQFLESAKS